MMTMRLTKVAFALVVVTLFGLISYGGFLYFADESDTNDLVSKLLYWK
jgi:hypothetical protein